MSDRSDLELRIKATDNASPSLQKVSKSIQQMGKDAQAAGKSAAQGFRGVKTEATDLSRSMDRVERDSDQAAASLLKMGQAAKRAGNDVDSGGRGLERFEKAATLTGAGLGTMVTALAGVGTAFVDQERQIAGVQRAYGDAGDEILAFTERIQDSTTFSNDAARQAALAAQSLAANYGLTAAQIEQVVTVSADLASVYGIDLLDATQRVAGAIRGEGEAAELLGLNLSDSAVAAAAAAAGIEGWTTTMTESEKAAFRMTLVTKQAAFATGAAGDAAETSAGQAKQMKNEFQDLGATLGEFAGPAAEVASVLGPFALLAPAAGAGLGKLAGIAAGAAGASGLGGLAVSIAGVGAAAAVAVLPLAAFTAVMIKGAQDRADDFTADFDAQTARLNRLGLAADENAKKLFDWVRTSNQTGGALNGQVIALNDSYDELLQLQGPYLATVLEVARAHDQGTASAAELGQTIIDLYQTQREGDAVAYAYGQQELYLGTQTEAYADAVGRTITLEQRLLTVRQQQTAQRNADINRTAGPRREGFVDPNDEGMGLPDATAQAERTAAAHDAIVAAATRTGDALREVGAAAAQESAELREAQQSVVDYIASGENLLQLLYESGKELSGDQGFIGGVIELQNALAGLESAYNIIIGGSERLGATSGQLADHYSELVGIAIEANGVFTYQRSLIDDLFAKGVIDQQQYNDAIDATTRILTSNMNIQNSIAAIQVQQAPYLADLNARTAEYVLNLADQDAQQQRNVLSLMDANSQQQLTAIYAAATDNAMGNLGANGDQFVQAMVDGLRITNPLLYETLKTAGDIDANGVFQFDGGDAATLVTTLGDLNTTLGDLAILIAEVNGLTISPKIDPAVSEAIRGFSKPTGGGMTAQWTGFDADALIPGGLNDGTAGPTGTQTMTQRVSIELDSSNFSAQVEAARAEVVALAGEGYTVVLAGDGANAVAVISDVYGNVTALVSDEYVFPIDADGDPAIGASNDVKGVVLELVNGEYVATINGDGSLAQSEIAAVNDALNAVNGTTGVVYITADGSNARYVIDSLTGFQGTAVINVVTTQPLSNALSNFYRDGGVVPMPAIPEARHGIVMNNLSPVRMNEVGGEDVLLPGGSMVIPAPASRGGSRPIVINVNIGGNVYGVDDLQRAIQQGVMAATMAGHR